MSDPRTANEILLEQIRKDRATMADDSPEASFCDLFIAQLSEANYREGIGESATMTWDDFQMKGPVNVT